MRILLIDDNKREMRDFVDELGQLHFEVTQATNPSEVTAAVDSGIGFDAGILDLMFPPIAGIPAHETDLGYRAGAYLWLELVETRLPGLPFVVLTAVDSSTRTFLQALEQLRGCPGFRGSFEKPVLVEDVLHALGLAGLSNG